MTDYEIVAYHVLSEIVLFVILKPLQVFEYARACVFDVLLGHFECLFKL